MANKYTEKYQAVKDRQKVEDTKFRQESEKKVDELNKSIPRDRHGQIKDKNDQEYALDNEGFIRTKDELNKPQPTEFQPLPGQGPRPVESEESSGGVAGSAQTTESAEEAGIEEAEIQEAEYANELAEEQELYEVQQQVEKLYQEGKSYGHPSFFKYFVILIPWAILVDIVDALTLTGLGYIVAVAFSWFSWFSILYILWLTDSNLNRAKHYTENLGKNVADLQGKIFRSTRFALKASKTMRKIPGMKGIARQIPRTLVKIRRFARKNPLLKVLIGGVINLIPVINLFNLFCVWVYFTYRDEKQSYKQAKEAAEEAYAQLSESVSDLA